MLVGLLSPGLEEAVVGQIHQDLRALVGQTPREPVEQGFVANLRAELGFARVEHGWSGSSAELFDLGHEAAQAWNEIGPWQVFAEGQQDRIVVGGVSHS